MIVKTRDIIALMKLYYDTSEVKGTVFALTSLENQKALKKTMQKLEEKYRPSNEFKEYLEKYIKLCNVYAQKDDAGNPLLNGGKIQIDSTNKSSFMMELSKLKLGYGSAVQIEEKKKELWEKELDTERFVELKNISINDLPLDLTAQQLMVLSIVITQEEE
jgi:hypothetical protein